MNRKPVAVDVFAGSGGLTVGLRHAGFAVRAAVEIDALAASTYRANHRGTALIEKDIVRVTGRAIQRAARTKNVQLLAGCAPCQGFCSLTRKVAREDPRNALILQMGRLVDELQPEAVFMENVPGLADLGRPMLDAFTSILDRLGYVWSCSIVQMADYGVPQSRRRFVLLAGRGFAIPLPKPTHARIAQPQAKRKAWLTVESVLRGRSSPLGLREAVKAGGARAHDWHVVRNLQPQTRARLKAASPGQTWLNVAASIRPDCHRGGYVGFTNVYGRMAWDRPSPTITAGCTTPAKGRFGHPDRRRPGTISVREAALLQTFPPEYKFATDEMDAVCQMIGNAVPPRFASLVARQIQRSLRDHREVR
jgi:DNA (cytosine-5)-methyltransferase 1